MRQILIRQTLATCLWTAGLLLALAGTVVTHAQTAGFAPEDQQAFEERVAGRMLHVRVIGGTDFRVFEFSDDGSGIVSLLGSLGYTYSRTGPNTATLSFSVGVGLTGCSGATRVFLTFTSNFDGTGWMPSPDTAGDTGCSVEFQIGRAPEPGVVISPTELQIDEGGTGTYTVVLDTGPEAGHSGLVGEVTLTSDNSDIGFGPSNLASQKLFFTDANWDVPQTVTVRAAHDADASDDSATLTHAHVQYGYGDVRTADVVRVNVVDDDSAGVTVTPTALTVDEGESGTYTVVLNTDPDPGRDGLTVTVTPDERGQRDVAIGEPGKR